MAVTGVDVLALQVRDLDRAAAFYETRLGLRRAAARPPGAVSSRRPASPSPSASRSPASTWTPPVREQADVPILAEPFDGPFGRTFTFADPRRLRRHRP